MLMWLYLIVGLIALSLFIWFIAIMTETETSIENNLAKDNFKKKILEQKRNDLIDRLLIKEEQKSHNG